MYQLKRAWAEIDLDAVEHNYREVRRLTGDKVKIMAVVKANAYGHGSSQVSRLLESCGADFFGVSNLMEGISLRRAGVEKPVLILGYTPLDSVRRLYEFDLIQTLLDRDYARLLAEAAAREGFTLNTHIKLDTGMNRIGFRDEGDGELISEVSRLCYHPNLKVSGIFTHFAAADEETPQAEAFTRAQHGRFMEVCRVLEENAYSLDIHCCNSAATVFYPEFHHSMVRPGIILYGCSPTGKPLKEISLKPAMKLMSAVELVKTVKKGEKISYGCTFEAPRDMRVASVPIGYADGYPRSLSNRGFAFARDKILPIVGRICMDQLMLDASEANVKPGDPVAFFGGDSPIEIETVAELTNTINYEIMCGVSRRVQRVYLRGGQICEVEDYTL
ncbi:MAG: alanine racemase [Oscillospiraceae bacterium]|nr:alanine racemase [Oscillospiraceae bacterium]